jgi:phage terminase large subunit GpA-like protein
MARIVAKKLLRLDIWRRGLRPEPQTLVSTWADAHRILPNTSAEPGKWRTSRTPYLREVMDCLSVASPIERVVLMKGSQLGATEAALNFCGFVIENAPGVLLYVNPTDSASRRNVRLRVDPLIDTTPELAALVTRRRSRQAGNTDSLKAFPGGQLSFVGANSAVGLRSTPARYVVADEVDNFPADADGEGDPVSLAIERTVTFAGRRKIFLLSTPTFEGVSRIAKAHAEGDQRKYFVPCPHCASFQFLKWQQVKWLGDDRAKAFYVCEHCGEAIYERHKQAMVAEGVWQATADGDGKTASFHLSGLYSPFVSWGEIALKQEAAASDPLRLQTWFNCCLGECFEDRAAIYITPARLQARATSWGPMLPDGVIFITAGVDVQMDRLEIEIVGWGLGEQSWSLEYHSLPGNPAEKEVWQRLDDLLKTRYAHRIVKSRSIMACCVDSGNWSKLVYEFTGPRFDRRIFAVKGSSDPRAAIWPRRPARPKDGRASSLFVIGSTAAKEVVVGRLGIAQPGPGYCNFPERDLDYFEQLLSEKPVHKRIRGLQQRVWVKAPNARNEALDARIYAFAALHALKSYGYNLDSEAAEVARMAPRPRPAPTVTRVNLGPDAPTAKDPRKTFGGAFAEVQSGMYQHPQPPVQGRKNKMSDFGKL